MSGWWTKYPMPEGWEAKYHWETKRFFYIDHINKKTVWNDPRIDLYKEAEGLAQSREGTLSGINERDESSSFSESEDDKKAKYSQNKAILREKKANDIHKKFPEFTLEKIVSLLESNYDNEFSVESTLNKELRHLIEEQEALEKIKEAERREKLAAVERDKKLKEEEMKKKAEEERNKRIMEETRKQLEEDLKKKTAEIDRKIAEIEETKRAEEAEKKRLEDVEKKRVEKEKATKAESLKKRDDKTKVNKTNNVPPKYENHVQASTSEQNKSFGSSVKSIYQRGPDKSIVTGADPLNYKGPNRDLLFGRDSSLAKGPDPLNHCGPQSRVSYAAS